MNEIWGRIKNGVKQALWGFIALILLFEEWGWNGLSAVLQRLGRWPPVAALERWVQACPPWAALCLMGAPALSLLPLKLVAIWLFANGHATLGLFFLLLLKLVGTAVVARLFQLTEPALMQLPWFAKYYPRFLSWKEALFTRIRQSMPWRLGRVMKRQIQQQWRQWRDKQNAKD